jgi:formamidopyrimidine-DNA glycosylase
MPELPDVENFRRHLVSTSLNRKIADVTVRKAKILAVSASRLRQALRGRRMKRTCRHGKQLLVGLDDGRWLTLHFGMTGRLFGFKDLNDDPKYDRVRFDFTDDGHLAFDDRRQLGRVGIVDDADDFIREHRLGPDALDPDLDQTAFIAIFAPVRATAKAALMDQSLMSGIGNILADEILFQARIHPQALVKALRQANVVKLYRALRKILKTVTARGDGTEQSLEKWPKRFLTAHREKGAARPQGRGRIKTLKLAGRTTYFCPACQTIGAPRRSWAKS